MGDSGDGIELTEDDISESTVEAKDKGTTGGAADEQQFPEDSNEDPEDEEADGTTVHPQRNHLNTCALPRSHFQKVRVITLIRLVLLFRLLKVGRNSVFKCFFY